MRIDKYKKGLMQRLENLEYGQCFVFRGELCMKVENDQTLQNETDFPNVIVNLETNKLNAVADSVEVMAVDVVATVGGIR